MAWELEEPTASQWVLEDEPVTPKATAKKGFMDRFSISNVPENAKNLAGGSVRGAGSIGSTLLTVGDLTPQGIISNIVRGQGFKPLEKDRQRRAQMDAGLKDLGVDTESGLYQTGKIGTEIAGTLGTGGAVSPLVAKLPLLSKVPFIENAVKSGGMTLNGTTGSKGLDMIVRMGGGGITGGVSAGMIDPEYAGTGAVVGAALPPSVAVLGKTGEMLKKATKGTVKNVLGMTTGTGRDVIEEAYRAGRNRDTSFIDNMTGKADFEDVLDTVKSGVTNMRDNRASAYRQGMADISADKSVLDFKPIEKALNNVMDRGSYKGVAINKNASGVVKDMADTIEQWKGLTPDEYHTPEGLDALKQAIGDIRDTTQAGTSARNAVDNVYNAIKGEISKQAPTYSKTMKDYADASKTLKELEKTFSLGEKASKDTAIRKMQSLMRNNASSNYGNRTSLARKIEQEGGVSFIPSLTGQAMNSWLPRGMSGAIQAGSLPLTAAYATKGLLAAPISSPRLMGNALYGLGSASAGVDDFANMLANMAFLPNGQQGLLGSALQENIVKPLPAIISTNRR